ncbi:MAG: cyclase family protein [Magnetospirillum sp.]|nr:cyclase family protein [Magnetospirillum sp.]
MTLLDITLTLAPTLPAWPGEPHARLERLQDLANGDPCTVTRLDTVVHCGTHVDAPAHFIPGGAGIDAVPLDVLMGPCWVADVADSVDSLTPRVLDGLGIPAEARRVLFRTRNSALWAQPAHDFHTDFVAFDRAGGDWAVARGLILVGIDYLSVEPFHHAEPWVHRTLLAAGIVPVEGLDLRAATAGWWQLACLPLKLPGADGSPARVVLTRDAD